MTQLYWIPGSWVGRLAISARPRGGDWLEDEMSAWRHAGVDTVVSLLAIDEEKDLELEREGHAVRASGMAFISFPIADRDVPVSSAALARLAAQLDTELAHGRNVAVHCRQGIGRAGLVAVSVLMTHGLDTEQALHDVSEARGVAVPETAGQRAWIAEFSAVPAPESR